MPKGRGTIEDGGGIQHARPRTVEDAGPYKDFCVGEGFISASERRKLTRNIIASTYTDRARVLRVIYSGVNEHEEIVYDNIPCALSRSAHTHSPTPMNADSVTPAVNYRLRLYAAPDVTFLLGDRVEITHAGRLFTGIASDSFYYDSHSVCVVDIEEVREE